MHRNNIRSRICKECGRSFLGGTRAWFCPECREVRQKKQLAEYRDRKRSGKVIPIGSTIKCEICGKDIIKNGGLQRFCDVCAAEHRKKINNELSLAWKANNPEKVREASRNFSKRRRAGDPVKSGITGVLWNKECRKWIACIWYKRKRYILYKGPDKETAIKERKEAEKHISESFLLWYEEHRKKQKEALNVGGK